MSHRNHNKDCPDCGKAIDDRASFCKQCCNRGERHPNYRGGKTITTAGYIRLLRPWHPLADQYGYVFEHRLVIEESAGRFLSPQEEVHHLNENITDNRLGNLFVCTRQQHKRLHQIMRGNE